MYNTAQILLHTSRKIDCLPSTCMHAVSRIESGPDDPDYLGHLDTFLVGQVGLICKLNAKQKHLGCKKGKANQKQQLSDYRCIRT